MLPQINFIPDFRRMIRISLNLPILLGATLMLAALPSRADHIIFKDGRTLDAFIVRKTDSQIVIRDGKTQIIVPQTSIASIEKGSPADHMLLEGRDALAAGEVNDAISKLLGAIEGGANAAEAVKLLVLHQEQISEAAPRMSGREVTEFGDLLDRLKGASFERPGEWLAAQARWRIELGHPDEMARLFELMREHEPRALEIRRDDLLKWLGDKTDRAIEEDNYGLALDLLLEMGRLDQNQAGDRRLEMALLWARRERDRKEFDSALRVYQDQLLPLSPQIGLDRIAVTLDDAERHYRDINQLGKAIDLYENYGMKHEPDTAADKLIALWHEFGKGFLEREEVSEARQIFLQSERLVPGSAQRELAMCDYAEMKKNLAPDDYVGHYKLGEWCVEKGLLDEARKAFQAAVGSEVLRETVWDQIQLINDHEAEVELKHLLNLYEAGQYVQVLDGTLAFKSRVAAEGLQAQATQLEKLARDAIAVSAAERPQQAEVLMQQAERAFWTGETEKAGELVKTLMEMYADTPAGVRAAQFQRTIRPRLDLDTLERRRGRNRPAETEGPKPPETANETSAIAGEIRRLREAMRERTIEDGTKKGNNDGVQEKESPAEDSPAVDLSVVTGQP